MCLEKTSRGFSRWGLALEVDSISTAEKSKRPQLVPLRRNAARNPSFMFGLVEVKSFLYYPSLARAPLGVL
jgi:hypothetical protein